MASGNWFSSMVQSLTPPATPQPNTPNNLGQILLSGTGITPPSAAAPNTQPGLNDGSSSSTFLNQLFQQLLSGVGSQQSAMPSSADLLKQATQQASQQYDPQIAAIQRAMGATQTRADTNKKELTNLYGGLASSYVPQAKAAAVSQKSQVANEKSQQANLQSTLANDTNNTVNQQNAQLANLGVSSAAGQASQNQKQNLQFAQDLAKTTGSTDLSSLNQEGNADQSYYNESQGIAKNEGTSAVSDLMSTLNDYMNQQQGSVADLQGQKAAAINTLQQQLSVAATKTAQSSQQTQWDNLYKLAQLNMTMNKAGTTYNRGLLGASQLLNQSVGQQEGSKLTGALQELLTTQPFRENRVNVGSSSTPKYIALTPEQAATYGGAYADQQGLPPADKLALEQAILAYYGKLG